MLGPGNRVNVRDPQIQVSQSIFIHNNNFPIPLRSNVRGYCPRDSPIFIRPVPLLQKGPDPKFHTQDDVASQIFDYFDGILCHVLWMDL